VEREVNRVRLSYEITGTGPWLVLAHSLGMRGEQWYQQVPVFAQQYRVLTYDARGHGNSEKPQGPYSFELLAEDLYQLLQAEGIEQTAAVGLSLGGNTVQALAAAHPDLVQALVLSDTTAWYGPQGQQNWEARAREVEEKGMAGIRDFQLTRWFTDPFRASHPELLERFAGWLTANDPAAFMASQRALGAGDLRDAVGAITCPTLIVVGEEDYATPPEMAQELRDRIPRSELVVFSSARHFSPVEQADLFNGTVLEFLARVGYRV
jgi:3-oxoadipate enol-lactonase